MNHHSEETVQKTVVDEGHNVMSAESLLSMDELIARPELSYFRTISTDDNTLEQLRERIRYLEYFVQQQNEALLTNESRERTHVATLRLFETTKTENEVLQNDRDKYFTESEFYKQQAHTVCQDLEHNKERLNDLNFRLVQTQRECNEKIVNLENELAEWKRRYESEIPHRETFTDNVGHAENVGHTENVGFTENVGHAENVGNAENVGFTENVGHIGSVCHTENVGFLENVGHTEPSHTGQGVELRGISNASYVADDLSLGRKRKCSFHKMKTRLPWCKNCMTVFDKWKPYHVECSFHRSFPQPLKAWQRGSLLENNKLQSTGTHAYKFWPCCEKISIREPSGCLKLKQHDLVYPEHEDTD